MRRAHPVPLEERLRIGADLRAGRYARRGERAVLARGLAVTVRDLWNWEHLPQGRPGRPRRSEALVRAAMADCRAEMERQGYGVRWSKVHEGLGRRYSTALVQECVYELKDAHRAGEELLRRLARVSVRVALGDVLWSVDETHLGRLEGGEAVMGVVVREVASTRTLVVSVGPEATAEDLVGTLEGLRVARGELPLVIAMDNGPAMKSEVVADYLAFHEVVALRNVAHVSRHNAWVERGHRDLKQESGLGRGVVLRDAREAAVALGPAVERLNEHRLVATRGMRTAAAVDEALPRGYHAVDRHAFFEAACSASSKAAKGRANDRERRKAEREAILRTMERFGLISRTRGGAPIPSVNRKSIP